MRLGTTVVWVDKCTPVIYGNSIYTNNSTVVTIIYIYNIILYGLAHHIIKDSCIYPTESILN